VSPFFIKKFKAATPCALCKRDTLSGYSLCVKHLEVARKQFENWANERRSIGRCIGCDRHALAATTLASRGKFQLRCWFHARINLARIRAWMAKHPGYSHRSWLKRKEAYKACREAGHEREGRRVCTGCSTRKGWGATQQTA
jgi:hypothetical protein